MSKHRFIYLRLPFVFDYSKEGFNNRVRYGERLLRHLDYFVVDSDVIISELAQNIDYVFDLYPLKGHRDFKNRQDIFNAVTVLKTPLFYWLRDCYVERTNKFNFIQHLILEGMASSTHYCSRSA